MKGYPYTPKKETTAERLGDIGFPMWVLLQRTHNPSVVDIRTQIIANLFLYSSMTIPEIAEIFEFTDCHTHRLVSRHKSLLKSDKNYRKADEKVLKMLEEHRVIKKLEAV